MSENCEPLGAQTSEPNWKVLCEYWYNKCQSLERAIARTAEPANTPAPATPQNFNEVEFWRRQYDDLLAYMKMQRAQNMESKATDKGSE